MAEFLKGVKALIIEQKIGKARKEILKKQLEKRGGIVLNQFTEDVNYVIADGSLKYDRILKILKLNSIPDHVQVVQAEWLSACIIAEELLSNMTYKIEPMTTIPLKRCGQTVTPPTQAAVKFEPSADSGATPDTSPTKGTKHKVSPVGTLGTKRVPSEDPDSDYVDSGAEEDRELADMKALEEEGLVRPPPKKGKWLCQIPATELKTRANHNKHITDKLEELYSEYKTSALPKDQWRAMSLSKAIGALKKHPTEITSFEEARSLPFVGERIADKIHEIISSGNLRRLDTVDKDKKKIIAMFEGVHGVGTKTAEQFYAQGYRTIQDLVDANILNRQQKIGVKYYDEFAERMLRTEVEEIESQVRDACSMINSGLVVVTCGSYRRGKPTCGDVDILVTHPDGRSHRGVFQRLIDRLKSTGFLTDDLTIHHDENDAKYLGVCILPGGGRKHRRIDIYICPYAEYPLMLLHFTGSGLFNRSMRNKADKMGMSLSEHSLNAGVIRKNGVKIFGGTPLPVFSEEDVFKYLDIQYLEPHDRDVEI